MQNAKHHGGKTEAKPLRLVFSLKCHIKFDIKFNPSLENHY